MNALLNAHLVLFVCLTAAADVAPMLINYQGRLTGEAGIELKEGQYGVEFRMYQFPIKSDADTLLWGAQYNLWVHNGAFNVVLGAPGGSPIAGAQTSDLLTALGDVPGCTNAPRYLELTIVSAPADGPATPFTIVPRQQLLSAPYALIARQLEVRLQRALCPVGSILAFSGTVAPDGWLLCDGRELKHVDYPELYDVIGTKWGTSDRAKTFRLPDLRGWFLRGDDPTATQDIDYSSRRYEQNAAMAQDNKIGTSQSYGTAAHNHSMGHWSGSYIQGGTGGLAGGDAVNWNLGNTSYEGIGETRPKNKAVNFIIKY